MNKNKIIILVIFWIILLWVLWLVTSLNSDKNTWDNTTSDIKQYNIWMYQDAVTPMEEVVENFKSKFPEYKNTQINIETFNDYEEYTLALASAFAKEKWPDLFTINNSDSSTLLVDYTFWIDPKIVNPNDFRKRYNNVFSQDLIWSIVDETSDEPKNIEFLQGIPVWYETLWIFYSRAKRLKQTDFDSISSLKSAISRLRELYPNNIPLGMGNGSTVEMVWEIISQFFLFEENVTSIAQVTDGKMKAALNGYMIFGDEQWENAYNKRYADMVLLEQNNVDLFARGEIAMIAGFPRLVKQIDEKWFRKSLLAAESFPFYFNTSGATSVNYNYFVKSKNLDNQDLSNALLQYFMSDSWAEAFLDAYDYYLPALLSLEDTMLDEEILDGYNITLNDFYNPQHPLVTFDKAIVNKFDENIIWVLDNPNNYIDNFWDFQDEILCSQKKYSSLENLSIDCK